MEGPPAWLQTFLDRLAADDLSAATRRGYRYDLLQFIAWYIGLNSAPPELARLKARTAPAHVVLQRLTASGPSDRVAKALTAPRSAGEDPQHSALPAR